MPTVLIDGPYRFFWYSADRNEPPHVHVERDRDTAKFWLDPVRLEWNHGFSKKQLNRVEKIVVRNCAEWLKRWRREFGN